MEPGLLMVNMLVGTRNLRTKQVGRMKRSRRTLTLLLDRTIDPKRSPEHSQAIQAVAASGESTTSLIEGFPSSQPILLPGECDGEYCVLIAIKSESDTIRN